VLRLVAQEGLLKGGTIAVDATTLEANAALRSIVRPDTDERHEEFLQQLAVDSGVETPTREQLTQFDKKRKNKGSNDDWTHPGWLVLLNKVVKGRVLVLVLIVDIRTTIL
jgi:transposase